MNLKKINIYKWSFPALAVIALLFTFLSVFSEKEVPSREPFVPPPQSEYDRTVSGIGVIEPKSELISIGVELPGVVREVFVKVGDKVKKGDILFQLDQRDIDAQIVKLEQSLEAAKVQAKDADTQFELLNKVNDKRAISIDEFNRKKYAKELAEVKVKEIDAELNQAKTTKARLTVQSPIDGQILEVNVRPGEYAAAGNLSLPHIRMGDVSRLHVRVEIDEENAVDINPKSEALATKKGDTSLKIPLTFVRFEPYVKPKQNLAVSGQRVDTRVLQIIYALPEGQEGLFVGQQMDVFIKIDKK